MSDSTTTTTGAEGGIDARLRAAWQRQRRLVSAIGLCVVLVAAVACLAAAFLLDWHLELPGRLRLVVLAATAAVVAAAAYFGWWRWRRPFDPARVAIQVEALHPELASVLVSHVQLRDRAGQAVEGSADMIRALGPNAVSRSAGLDFGRIVDFRRLRRPAAWCLAALAAAALWTALRPELVAAFARRFLNPAATERYPTQTLLELAEIPGHVQEGSPLELAALAGGVTPARGTLTIRAADGTTRRLVLEGSEPDAQGRRRFAHALDAVYDDLQFTFRVGDATTVPATVAVVGPPAISPVLEVTPPGYVGGEPARIESLSTEVAEGSKVAWRLESDRPLAAAEMIMDDGTAVPLELSADGREARHTLEPAASFTYGFRWTDRDHGFVHAPPVRHAIRVEPDSPPSVLLVSPNRDLKATPRKQLDLSFEAEDDHGVDAAWVVYTLEGPAVDEPVEERIEIPLDPAASRGTLAATHHWNLLESIPDLEPGDIVRFAVEVRDNRPGRPWLARSESRRLSVVTIQEYAQFVVEERDRLLIQLKQVYDEERDAVGSVDRLRTEPLP